MRWTGFVVVCVALVSCSATSNHTSDHSESNQLNRASVDIEKPGLHASGLYNHTLAAAGGDAAAGTSLVALPNSHRSDTWVNQGKDDWAAEQTRRQQELAAYLHDTDPSRATDYAFRNGHTPALAWNWFDQHPIGYGGVPFVLLQTILSLDPATETDPHLLRLAHVWKKRSTLVSEQLSPIYTLDHLGLGPHPQDYVDGIALEPGRRQQRLPNGLVFDPEVVAEPVSLVSQRLKWMRDGLLGRFARSAAALVGRDYEPGAAKMLVLLRGKIRQYLYGDPVDYDSGHASFQQAPKVDPVFFSCSACHQGRVLASGNLNDAGNVTDTGPMLFLPGMPNTEVEAQYYSKLLMQTGLVFIESGFAADADALPEPDAIVPNKAAVMALYTRLLSRAIDDETVGQIYGTEPAQIQRARWQTYHVARDFPTHMSDLIGLAVKTQFIYYQISQRYAYNGGRQDGDIAYPDVLEDRLGQMDAFGAASALPALHTLRPDNSYIRYLYQDNPDNPLFTGLPDTPGFAGAAGLEAAGQRMRDTVADWAPAVPAPIDIKSLNWTGHRELANWDGNQGASARTLASGTSATGDPRRVNVRIHEPLNPLINHLPAPAYPFAVDQQRAQRGLAIFNGKHLSPRETCSNCHRPNNASIYPASFLGVDANRSLITSDVARYGMAGLVKEACTIFIRNNPDNAWCLPQSEAGEPITDWDVVMDDYFKDTPGRVRSGRNGYKADMLHGIWAQAPYLHNGSVPTLMQLLCPGTRPTEFYRGVLIYDQSMVGFAWHAEPRQRYSPHETQSVKRYDTTMLGRSNQGHHFGATLCPDTQGLDPLQDREEIARRISRSHAGDLIEYLKTL